MKLNFIIAGEFNFVYQK